VLSRTLSRLGQRSGSDDLRRASDNAESAAIWRIMAVISHSVPARMKNGFIDGVFESIVGGTRALARR